MERREARKRAQARKHYAAQHREMAPMYTMGSSRRTTDEQVVVHLRSRALMLLPMDAAYDAVLAALHRLSGNGTLGYWKLYKSTPTTIISHFKLLGRTEEVECEMRTA